MQIGYITFLVNACKNCSFLFGVSGRHATIHIPQEVGNLGLVLGLGRSISMWQRFRSGLETGGQMESLAPPAQPADHLCEAFPWVSWDQKCNCTLHLGLRAPVYTKQLMRKELNNHKWASIHLWFEKIQWHVWKFWRVYVSKSKFPSGYVELKVIGELHRAGKRLLQRKGRRQARKLFHCLYRSLWAAGKS